jgi:hypothetical protein
MKPLVILGLGEIAVTNVDVTEMLQEYPELTKIVRDNFLRQMFVSSALNIRFHNSILSGRNPTTALRRTLAYNFLSSCALQLLLKFAKTVEIVFPRHLHFHS